MQSVEFFFKPQFAIDKDSNAEKAAGELCFDSSTSSCKGDRVRYISKVPGGLK
jgi:hypothetical protein